MLIAFVQLPTPPPLPKQEGERYFPQCQSLKDWLQSSLLYGRPYLCPFLNLHFMCGFTLDNFFVSVNVDVDSGTCWDVLFDCGNDGS